MTNNNFQGSRNIAVDGNAQGTFVTGNHNTINHSTTNAAPLPDFELNPFKAPARNPAFAGREAVISQLHKELTKPNAMKQVISGLGGMGKTQTAVEYAHRYHYDQCVYKTVFWVKADTEVNLDSDFAAIAEQVAVLGARSFDQEDRVKATQTWLAKNNQWLLIFDNVDDPKWLDGYMSPNPNGKVLVTSRLNVFDRPDI